MQVGDSVVITGTIKNKPFKYPVAVTVAAITKRSICVELLDGKLLVFHRTNGLYPGTWNDGVRLDIPVEIEPAHAAVVS